MKKLFLTSSIGESGVGRSIRTKISTTGPLKTAFITTPIEVEDMSDDGWYQADRKALRENGFDFFDYTISGKTASDFERDLGNVDVIYVSGGNTRHLLNESKKSGFISFIQNFVESGKIYIGTSAGSIIAGPTLPPYLWDEEKDAPELASVDAYNFINFTIVPHWGSQWFRELYLSERIDHIYAPDLQPFILLNDHEYVEILGDKYRIVDSRGEA